MNKREVEVQRALLAREKRAMTELKVIYSVALDDVKREIVRLKAMESTQSRIYQIEYQRALMSQLEAIITALNGKNYLTVMEYLSDVYEDGYWGVFYNLQGQGIPLIVPIPQDQIAMVVLNTYGEVPLSERLWKNADDLKNRIRGELSRGIAQGMAYSDIARNLANQIDADYKKTLRIARTEGHRVGQASSYNASLVASENGADIVKQWDATFDSRTRPTHREADGQIRAINEPFSVGMASGQYPGGTGVAKEDINCRCVSLQRARWALEGEEDSTKWDNTINQHVIVNDSDDFNDFKLRVP